MLGTQKVQFLKRTSHHFKIINKKIRKKSHDKNKFPLQNSFDSFFCWKKPAFTYSSYFNI